MSPAHGPAHVSVFGARPDKDEDKDEDCIEYEDKDEDEDEDDNDRVLSRALSLPRQSPRTRGYYIWTKKAHALLVSSVRTLLIGRARASVAKSGCYGN